MAEKKSKEAKIILERTYNVPLRKGFQKAPKYRRAKKAINVLKEFLAKHMKSDDVRIGNFANLKIWERGIKNPPHHVKVNATRDSEGVVRAEIVGAPVAEKKADEAPKKKTKAAKKKAQEETEIKKALGDLEVKTEKLKQEKAEDAKEIEKEEIKELKDKPQDVPKEAKMPKVESTQKIASKPKAVSAPHGGQKMEPHHGSNKQQKKE